MMTRGRIVSIVNAEQTTPDGPKGARIVRREVVEAMERAKEIVALAQIEAERIEADAQMEAERTVQTATEKAQSLAEAVAAANAIRLTEQVSRASKLEHGILISTAVALAERLLMDELHIDPSAITRLAEAALAEVRGTRRARVRSHPLDAPTLQTMIHCGETHEALEVIPDESLARGDIRIETDLGVIDASIRTRLERLARTLHHAL